MPKKLKSQALSYDLLFPLKETATKQVYKALRREKETGIEQVVLLKIFSKEEKSFKGELESLLESRSKYCARLLGFESFYQKKALVLEYIHGVSLSQLSENFHLSDLERTSLLAAIYKGLLDLKEQGLAHGDLSLDNVLIDSKGQIKFIDFGKGNYQDDFQATFPFVAPELLHGGSPQISTDLFSLGVIEKLLESPLKTSSFKDPHPKDFASKEKGLLCEDPAGRSFPYDTSSRIPDSLIFKINSLLSSLDLKRCETVKIKKEPKAPLRYQIKKLSLLLLITFLAGFASFSSSYESKGFLNISTNKWFSLSMKHFSNYSPFMLYLPAGFHKIKWESSGESGSKIVHIRSKKFLLLNDEDLL